MLKNKVSTEQQSGEQIAALQIQLQQQQEVIRRLEETLAQERADADIWRKRLESLLFISETTGDALYANQIFYTIARTVLSITGYDGMGLGIYDKDKRQLRLVAHEGLPDIFQIGRITPAREGDYHDILIRTQQPVYTSDYALDPRASEAEEVLLKAGLQSMIFIPAVTNGQLMGAFGLHSRKKVDWDQDQIRWLTFIGRQIGLLIHQDQMVKQSRVAAILEEGMRIGRELHDSTIQIFGYLNLKSRLVQNLLQAKKYVKAQNELKDLEEVSSKAYDDMRDSILTLRFIPSLDQELISVLGNYCQEFGQRNKIEIKFNADQQSRLFSSPEIDAQVLRIVQEALTNIRRHAKAQNVQFTFKMSKGHAVINIQDDGQGFDIEQVKNDGRQHLGIQTMKERADGIGVVLEIKSQIGKGTAISIKIPAPAKNG